MSMYSNTTFVIHKPVNVISSKVDPAVTKPSPQFFTSPKTVNPNKKPKKEREFESRPTVYETADKANFPTNFGLVGRLDYETSGLMLMTCDNNLASAIRDPVDMEPEVDYLRDIGPGGTGEIVPYKYSSGWVPPEAFDLQWKEKEYIVKCLSPRVFHEDADTILAEMMEPLSFSRFSKHIECKPPTALSVVRKYQDPEYSFNNARPYLGWCIEFRFVLREGKHHQIRRICNRSKLKVLSLTRVRLANILSLESVPVPGDCRWLTTAEMDALYAGYGIDKSCRTQTLTCSGDTDNSGGGVTTGETTSASQSANTGGSEGILTFVPACIVRVTGMRPAAAAAAIDDAVNAERLKQAVFCLMTAAGKDTGNATASKTTGTDLSDASADVPLLLSSLRYVDYRGGSTMHVRTSLPAVAVRVKTALESACGGGNSGGGCSATLLERMCAVLRIRGRSATAVDPDGVLATARAELDGEGSVAATSGYGSDGDCLTVEILAGDDEIDYWRLVRWDADGRKRLRGTGTTGGATDASAPKQPRVA
jgi:16S rRNA U516 pseudouridylate synthase RsuA-like enzyme